MLRVVSCSPFSIMIHWRNKLHILYFISNTLIMILSYQISSSTNTGTWRSQIGLHFLSNQRTVSSIWYAAHPHTQHLKWSEGTNMGQMLMRGLAVSSYLFLSGSFHLIIPTSWWWIEWSYGENLNSYHGIHDPLVLQFLNTNPNIRITIKTLMQVVWFKMTFQSIVHGNSDLMTQDNHLNMLATQRW